MKAYLNLLANVCKETGAFNPETKIRPDRTKTGTYSTFGKQMEVDLRDGFPALTTKKVAMQAVLHELLWFLSGDTNLAYLHENKVSIWDEWADDSGDLGPVYGFQWRRWENSNTDCVDQIARLLHELQIQPMSRRHVVSAWNAGYVADSAMSPQENVAAGNMALSPCHVLFQVYVQDMSREDKLESYRKYTKFMGHVVDSIDEETLDFYLHKESHIPTKFLDMQVYMRSADIFLGVPFNIASYAMLAELLAAACGFVARRLIFTFGDLHLYSNHVEQAITQLEREPLPLPRLKICGDSATVFNILSNRSQCKSLARHLTLMDYNPHSSIKAEISV